MPGWFVWCESFVCCASSRTCASWSWASRRHEKLGNVVNQSLCFGLFSWFPTSVNAWVNELEIHSWELTYPTFGRGKSSSELPFLGDMLVSGSGTLFMIDSSFGTFNNSHPKLCSEQLPFHISWDLSMEFWGQIHCTRNCSYCRNGQPRWFNGSELECFQHWAFICFWWIYSKISLQNLFWGYVFYLFHQWKKNQSHTAMKTTNRRIHHPKTKLLPNRLVLVTRWFDAWTQGIMGSFKALAWALLLLFIIIYVTGRIRLAALEGCCQRKFKGYKASMCVKSKEK